MGNLGKAYIKTQLLVKTIPVLGFAIFICLFSFGKVNVFAQRPDVPRPIPSNNEDIEQIARKAKVYKRFARECSFYDCPNFDCRTAQNVFIRANDTREYLRHLHFWLKRASDSNSRHWKDRIGGDSATAERIANAQMIVAYQEYVVSIAATMLDVTSAAGNLKTLTNDNKALENMSPSELIGKLDALYEGASDLESSHSKVKSKKFPRSTTKPKFFSLGDKDVDDLKSSISNIRSVVGEAAKAGKDWRKAYKSAAVRASIGAIIGRFAKNFADSEIQKRKNHIKQLVKELTAGNSTRKSIFDDYMRSLTRRNLVGKTISELDYLLVTGSGGKSGILTRCLLKARNTCPMINVNYVSRIDIPSKFRIFDPRISNNPKYDWGAALLYLNPKLSQIGNSLANRLNLDSDISPSLTLSKSSFDPDEKIIVRFKSSPCYSYGSWAGIVPSRISRGSEEINRRNIIGTPSILRRRINGELIFRAPKQSGSYEIRLNETVNRRGVARASFTVRAKTGNLKLEVVDVLGKQKNVHVTFFQNGKELFGAWTEHSPFKLPPGNYVVGFDYALGIRRTVQVTSGENTKEVVQKVSGRLELSVIDSAGKPKNTHLAIYRGGQEVVGMWTEHAPIDLPPGVYRVKFSIGDGVERTATIKTGQVTKLQLTN